MPIGMLCSFPSPPFSKLSAVVFMRHHGKIPLLFADQVLNSVPATERGDVRIDRSKLPCKEP
jgi:hypothetical protein